MRPGKLLCFIVFFISTGFWNGRNTRRSIAGLYEDISDTIELGSYKEYILFSKKGIAYFSIDSVGPKERIKKDLTTDADWGKFRIIGDSVFFSIDSIKSKSIIKAHVFGEDRVWVTYNYFYYFKYRLRGKISGDTIDFKMMALTDRHIVIDGDKDASSGIYDTSYHQMRFLRSKSDQPERNAQ